jgi:hypothetical protein
LIVTEDAYYLSLRWKQWRGGPFSMFRITGWLLRSAGELGECQRRNSGEEGRSDDYFYSALNTFTRR